MLRRLTPPSSLPSPLLPLLLLPPLRFLPSSTTLTFGVHLSGAASRRELGFKARFPLFTFGLTASNRCSRKTKQNRARWSLVLLRHHPSFWRCCFPFLLWSGADVTSWVVLLSSLLLLHDFFPSHLLGGAAWPPPCFENYYPPLDSFARRGKPDGIRIYI